MRLNINLADYLVEDTDKRAKELRISRSAYIALALQFKAQYDDTMKSMPDMITALNSAAAEARAIREQTGSVSHE